MQFLSFLLFLSLRFIRVPASTEGADWCYEIEVCKHNCTGPRKWMNNYHDCGGSNQSPINIVTKNAEHDSSLKEFDFKGYDTASSGSFSNNGHSALLTLNGVTNTISSGGLKGTFTAIQLHFHWGADGIDGSEHHIDGVKFPMELHIVHQNTANKDDLAVLGFMYKVSSTNNEKYKKLIDAISKIPDLDNKIDISDLKLQDLIPEQKYLGQFYRYKGSLTTPPCTESVTWTVFPQTIELSKDQLKMFYEKMHSPKSDLLEENYRPVQPLGSRTVYYSRAGALLAQHTPLLMSLVVFCLMITS
ncbi:carbonic anhydrase 4 [Discoglossus pictus]